MKSIKLIGSFPAIVTPFYENGDLDLPTMERLVDFQLAGGVDGIVVAGSTGEGMTLSDEEYQKVVSTVVKKVNGRVPVIAGAGSNDTKKAVYLSKLAKEAGVDALLHVTPYYNKPTTSGLILHFKAIVRAVDLPIIIYNVPGRTASNVLPQNILKIARAVPQIKAVKEASGSLAQMMEIVAEVEKNGPKGFTVLSGEDVLALPLVALGGHGCISVVCNEVPKLFSDMIHSGLRGRTVEARKIHYKILDLMNLNFVESNPIPLKAALSMMGLVKESLRLPLSPLGKENKLILKKTLKKLKLI